MQNFEQKNSNDRMLADAELDAITGGGIIRDIIRTLGRIFGGPGDLRRPTNRP